MFSSCLSPEGKCTFWGEDSRTVTFGAGGIHGCERMIGANIARRNKGQLPAMNKIISEKGFDMFSVQSKCEMLIDAALTSQAQMLINVGCLLFCLSNTFTALSFPPCICVIKLIIMTDFW